MVEPNYQTTIYLVAEGQNLFDVTAGRVAAIAEIDVDRPQSWDDARFLEAAYDPRLVAAIEALQARVRELEENAVMNLRPFLSDY